MDWAAYGAFVTFAVVVVLLPGADFAVVVGNTLAGGRRRGSWCAAGVTTSNTVQGAAGAAGLGALIAGAQPVMQAVKWAGVLYLLYLGVRTVRSAVRGRYAPLSAQDGDGAALGGWRQGFLSNITNPKVLMFYLAVLPQFLAPDAGLAVLLLYAVTHAALSLAYLLLLTAFLHRLRHVLTRRPIRRALDALTGLALLAFGARLAAERV
ncbi:LysE family translocator [Sphaerisporangium sp. B11E5]|uniref:LysE family translocator n=1 Tax=Sphaerisporangium sp. B11E5 TaxID=3153563 RepID=UPI00325D05DC